MSSWAKIFFLRLHLFHSRLDDDVNMIERHGLGGRRDAVHAVTRLLFRKDASITE